MRDSGRELTVGMPVRNGERYLEGALRTILDQDVDLELLVGDNASDDRTEEICRDHASTDDRIRYHRHGVNVGANRNFNWLVEQSRSPLFRWAAVDDLLDGPVLERCVAALRHEPAASLASTRTVLIDDQGRPVRQHVDDEARAAAADP
ncbi:MAG: glycosyltransferase family A protein, partial [Actinomycetota bacterium]